MGPHFWRICRTVPQAMVAWQWWNAACERVPAGKHVLRINLDETSVCLYQGEQKGNLLLSRRRLKEEGVAQKVSRSKRRCCLTHVAVICDKPDLQPAMPQVILGNAFTFQAGQMVGLRSACPPNVHLVRQKSAWNNIETMKIVIRLIADAVKPHGDHLQPILLLDACRVHLARSVLATCVACRIWPIIIPAKLTWLLQPCDTHAFHRYKVYLKKVYQEARAATLDGQLSVAQFLPCVYATVRRVLQGQKWSEAFDQDGFGHRQGQTSVYVRRMLQQAGEIHAPDGIPTEGDLQLCFPKGATVPKSILLRPLQPPREALPVARRLGGPIKRCGAKAAALPRPAGAEPRTRAQHRRLVAEAAAPAALAVAAPAEHSYRTRRQVRLAGASHSGALGSGSSSSKGP